MFLFQNGYIKINTRLEAFQKFDSMCSVAQHEWGNFSKVTIETTQLLSPQHVMLDTLMNMDMTLSSELCIRQP